MIPEPVSTLPRPTVLQVGLKAAALIQTMTEEEVALLDGLLRHHYSAPPTRRGRPSATIAAALTPEPKILAVTGFIAANTFPDYKGSIRTADFMQRFTAWARDNGVRQCATSAEVQATLAKAGYAKRKSNGQSVFAGLSWNAAPADQVMDGAMQ
jgi:hypothetical protein